MQPIAPNPAQPAAGVRLCALADLRDPGAKGFLFREGDSLFMGFITLIGGAVTGWVDRCPHVGLPLAVVPNRYLTPEGDLILCGSHGALFRVSDGRCIGGPCAGKALRAWPVRIEGEDVVTA